MAASGAKAKKKVLPASGSSERTNTRGRSTKTSRRGGPMERQYVGIDLHRRRSVIVRMDESGEKLETVRIDNDPVALGLALAEAGPDPEVALEATYGWYWAADALQAAGARVHLVHPSGLHWGARRVKNDQRDATEIAHRLRRNDLPEAWIAPPKLRELRELVRFRAKLVALRSGLKAQVHAVLAKQGVLPRLDDIFGPEGQRFLDEVPLDEGYTIRVGSRRDLIELYDREIAMLEPEIHRWLRHDAGYRAIQSIHGVGRTMAAIFVAEIGDVQRFPTGPAPVLLGRSHPQARRVRHQGHPRADHPHGLSAGAVGRHRSSRPLPRRARHPPRLPADRGAARHQDRPRRRGPQGSH